MEHTKEFLQVTEDAKSRMWEILVADTLKRVESSAILIDVREDNEVIAGDFPSRNNSSARRNYGAILKGV